MSCLAYKILFGVFASLFIILILLIFIMYKLTVSKWAEVFNNNEVCLMGQGKCKITPNDNLKLPETVDNEYKATTAQFCLDIVSRIANMYEIKNFAKPPNLSHVYDIISDPNSKKPIIGKIFTDNQQRAWVAFRGTQTTDELSKDLKFHQTTILKKQKQIFLGTDDNVKVHEGFWKEYKLFRSKLLQFFKTNAAYTQIIITGHSLGSALAVLLSYDLMQTDQKNKLIVYLFACPRVGNIEFQESFKVTCFNIVNQSDVIPTMPFSVMPNDNNNVFVYSHVGELIHFQDNWKSLGNNHSVALYVANILKT